MTNHRRFLIVCLGAAIASPAVAGDVCTWTAKQQRKAAWSQLSADLKTNIALCYNITDPGDRADCLLEAFEEFGEGVGLAFEQYEARLDLCDKLGGGAYDPEIDPEDFTCVIDNPYLPFPVGAEWVYESETEEGMETIVVTVIEETREILGVECISVRDVVMLEGEPVEDTIDWYAQDSEGNVWYFGEISFNFEDGFVADIEGSWLSGVDGAKPGIVMLADPVNSVGTTYRQEWLINEAEDAGTVVDAGVTVVLDFDTFHNCVKTEDFLPPEPDALEFKYFAPGIGFIYETKDDSDETVELVSYSGL